MVSEDIKRKLTTILAADVEGYSRLMRADEEATLKTLGEYREIIDGLIGRHDGRVFSTGGDSVLAEFGSAVEAVRGAISIQEEIASRNTELADDRKLMFRIGINVGDVMVRDDDLFGDGVNVAARLEGLAQPGGVCVSGSVFEQIKHKLSLGFEDMGAQEVKNIAEPVSAYRLVPGQVAVSAGATAAAGPSAATIPSPGDRRLVFVPRSGRYGGARRGTLSQREKVTGRAFDRQIGSTKRGDRYANCRIRPGFAFDRQTCYATGDASGHPGTTH